MLKFDERKRLFKKKKKYLLKSQKKISIKSYVYYFLLFLIIFFLILKVVRKTPNKFEEKNFICFCALAKKENLYIRELVNYHKNIGFSKFILVDNNDVNSEKLSDVLQDYIKSGLVEIINSIGQSINQGSTYQYLYENYKDKCQWINFFDCDEYLVLYPQNGKNITIREFLENPRYDKCESILINWLMYDDNDLLHYENRTLIERFTRAVREHKANRFVKSITRGGLNRTLFGFDKSSHFPSDKLILCDSSGKTSDRYSDVIEPPIYEFAHVSHYSTKSTEEYVNKIRRRYPGVNNTNYEESIDVYFGTNKFTKEKLKIFEDSFNHKFPDYKHDE